MGGEVSAQGQRIEYCSVAKQWAERGDRTLVVSTWMSDGV